MEDTTSRRNRSARTYYSSSSESEDSSDDHVERLILEASRRGARTVGKKRGKGKKRNPSKDAFMRTIAQEMLSSLLGEDDEDDGEDGDNEFIKNFRDRYEENKVWAKQRRKKSSSKHSRHKSTSRSRRTADSDDDSYNEERDRDRSRSPSRSKSRSHSRSKRSEDEEVSDIDSDAGMSELGGSRRSKSVRGKPSSNRSYNSGLSNDSRASRRSNSGSRQSTERPPVRDHTRHDSVGHNTVGSSSNPSRHSSTNRTETTTGSGPALSINEIKQYVMDSIPVHLKDQIPEDAWEQIFAGGSKSSNPKVEEDDEMNDDIESAVVDPRLGQIMRVDDVCDFDDDMSDITGLHYDFPEPEPLSAKRLSLDNNTRTSDSTGTVPTETSTSIAASDRPRHSRSRHASRSANKKTVAVNAPDSPPTPPAGSSRRVSSEMAADIVSVDLDTQRFTEPRRGFAAAAPMKDVSDDDMDSLDDGRQQPGSGRAESVGVVEQPNVSATKPSKSSKKKKSRKSSKRDDDSSSNGSSPSYSGPKNTRRLRDAAVPAVIEEEPSRSNRMRGGVGLLSPPAMLGSPLLDDKDGLDPLSEEQSLRERRMSMGRNESVHRAKTEPNVPPPPSGRLVSFTNVEIRCYERIMSDNPSVTSGVGIGIGWHYYEGGTFSVNNYEQQKEEDGRSAGLNNVNLLVPRHEREFLLRELGYTQKDIADATRNILKTKNQRKQTVNNLNATAVEEAVESAKKKVKKLLRFGVKKNFVKNK